MSYVATKLVAARAVETSNVLPVDAVPVGHVRLRLAAASLCGTDLHYYSDIYNEGSEPKMPETLRHEACAWVEEPNGSDLETGQLVALNPVMNCQECAACQPSEENLCRAKKFPGSATTVPHIDGFFREIFDHPVRCSRPVNAGVNSQHLTFAEPLSWALYALNKAEIREGHSALVTGCGPMGLLTVAAAACGARVTAIDLRPAAVNAAISVGAETGIVATDLDESALDTTFDRTIEASGAVVAFNTALKALRQQGRLSHSQLHPTVRDGCKVQHDYPERD